MEAVTPPPLAVTPPPLAVTPPPVREALAVTPPPRREMEAVTPPPVREALAVTPPPIPEALAVTPPPKREMKAATSPPVRETLAVTPPPRREMEAATPPPVREALAVTPPPKREMKAATPPPRREMEAVTPPPVREALAVPPPPRAATALPPPEPVTSHRSVAEIVPNEAPGGGAPPPASQAGAAPGAMPETPIKMAETAEVVEGEFEVMEAGDTPSSPSSLTPTPPPVPGIAGVTAAASPTPGREVPSEAGGSVGGGTATALASAVPHLPEALSRRPLKKRLKPWFEEVFDEDYLRTLPFMTSQQTLRETAFIMEALSPPAASEVLDIACGYGRHAIELGQRGCRVTGLDLSLPLLIRAADEAQRRGLSVNFVHADMREMTYDSQFDAAYCVLTSFGYFDEETNLRVASSIFRALKPGGRVLVDTINRDYIVSDLPSRVWWEGDGCVVLEEVDFDFHTSRVMIRRSIVFGDGRQVENEISIRAYSLHELGRVLRRAGFQILEASGSLAKKEPFLGAASRHVVLVCERPLT
jgi:Methylase involved in ubiquinone/menaquinone biosynthesis